MVHASAANPDWQVDFGLAASSSHLPQVPLAQHLRFPQDVARLGKTISDFPDVGIISIYQSPSSKHQSGVLTVKLDPLTP